MDIFMRVKSFRKMDLEYFCFLASETASELSAFNNGGETVLYYK